MVNFEKHGNKLSVEPTLLRISDKLSLRYEKSGHGPPLVLLHTIRTQLEYFRSLAAPLSQKSSPSMPWICRATVTLR
jgi:hypothetical protein